jgi:hypothetical protein
LLLPISRGGPFLNVVQTLFYLARALLERSEEFEQPEGIKYAMEYLRYIRRFPLDSFDVPRTLVTTSLIRALRAQVRSGAGNWTQDIKEMVVLCNELLSSNKSEDVPTAAFSYLNEAVTHVELNHGIPTEILDEVIECLRDAVKVCSLAPDSYEVMYALAYALNIRFIKTHSKEDYEEATVVLERILEPGGCPDSFRVLPSSLAITLAHGRSASSRNRNIPKSQFLASVPYPVLLPWMKGFVFYSLRAWRPKPDIRFREYSLDESLEEANSYISQLVNASSSSSLAESAELSWSERFERPIRLQIYSRK